MPHTVPNRPEQRRNRRNAVQHAQVAPQHVGDALAFVEHGLLDFDGRLAPFADRRGKHAGDVARFVLAALQRFVAIERAFAKLQQESLDEQPRHDAPPPQADQSARTRSAASRTTPAGSESSAARRPAACRTGCCVGIGRVAAAAASSGRIMSHACSPFLGQQDKETRRSGDKEMHGRRPAISLSPCLLVSLSVISDSLVGVASLELRVRSRCRRCRPCASGYGRCR